MTKIKMRWDTSDIKRGLRTYQSKVEGQAQEIAEYYAPQMERDAKQNAPWADRTGNARQSLNARATPITPSVSVITLAYGNEIDYGEYLELRWEGRFATIIPTIDYYAARIRRERGFK
jgi:hypothetical protein